MLRLVKLTVCKETVSVLRYLLQLAIKGELRGIAVCYWRSGDVREVLLTGAYQQQPEHAFSAADLIKIAAGHQLNLFA